jgi:hypothetical protein
MLILREEKETIMKIQSHTDRIAMIREVAERRAADKVAVRPRKDRNVKDAGDERLWTDERKYAQLHYGDVFHETTRHDHDRFDPDWN